MVTLPTTTAPVHPDPAGLEAAYATVRATSIDDAVLEPAASAWQVAMLRGPWTDTGSRSTLVFAADRPVVTIGLSDVIVVDAGDVVLVASAGASQQVKAAAERWAAEREC